MFRATLCAVLLLVLSGLPAAAGPVTLLSKADPGNPSGTAGGVSGAEGISADGRYVVFLSGADNLLAGIDDANAGNDIFFHDRIAGTTVLVSHAAGDPTTTGDGGVEKAVLSADGRWVAFVSTATDLIAGQVDSPASSDVFLWDRDTDVTVLVSHQEGLATTAAGDSSFGRLGISGNGSRIAFTSAAQNLVPGQVDTASSSDAFLYDRASGLNALASYVSGAPTAAAGVSGELALSADGNWLAFVSNAIDIVSGQIDSNGGSDIFLYDSATGSNILVSHASSSASTVANNDSFRPQISADGGRIAYVSPATNLMAGQSDGNTDYDIFLYDRTANTSTLVSHTSSSATTAANQYSDGVSLSADGRYVAYVSGADDLVANDENPLQDVFFYDHVAGSNLLLSGGSVPSFESGDSFAASVSADGAWVVFWSQVPDLVTGQVDDLGSLDAFLWSRATGTVTLMTRTAGSATTAASDDQIFSEGEMRISADGSWIALGSVSEDLVDGADDHNGLLDVFLFERATGVNHLLTPRGGAISTSAGSYAFEFARTTMSNDGRYIAFTSDASNLPGITDGNNRSDIFLHDRLTGTTSLVSHANGSLSTAANGISVSPLMSTDGSVVVFVASASDLITGPGPSGRFYLYERTSGAVTLIDHAPSSPSIGAGGFLQGGYTVSGDGRWVAYSHSGSLVAGQVEGNGWTDIFLFDRTTGTNTLVSHASSSALQTANNSSQAPSISADGRYIAFASLASNLVPGQVGAGGIFLHDRIAGTTVRVSASGTSTFTISADGRWIAFTSSAANVVPGQVDTNSDSDVFLWDRVSGSTLLVSRTPASATTAGNAGSDLDFYVADPPVISANGRWVVFLSRATNLISGQTGIPGGAFLFDRISGTVTLVSRSVASPTDARSAFKPTISADGHFVAFASLEDDLVPGQVDPDADMDYFLYDRIAGTTALASHIPSSDVTSGSFAGGFFFVPRISADGAWMVFHSPQPDLVAGDHDGAFDTFLHATPLPGRDLYTAPPCRIVDTRLAGQGPALTSGVKRTLTIHGGCGVPATARAVAVNVTVTSPSAAGYLSFHPGDLAMQMTSTILFNAGQIRSNNVILPLAFDGSGTVAVTPLVGGNGTVHLTVDVSGWFE